MNSLVDAEMLTLYKEKQDRIALLDSNVANLVKRHLEVNGLGCLLGLSGVYVVGSRVWSWLYGLDIKPGADVDIMIVGEEDFIRTRRRTVVELLGLADIEVDTAPSMAENRDSAVVPGRKYLSARGRIVDIWGMADIHRALQQYPEHSHASSRAAYDCEHQCLIVYPNSSAAAVM